MEWKERISRFIALGMYDQMTTPELPENINHYVAAGNPGKSFSEYPSSLSIPDTFIMGKKQCKRQDYTIYTVSGNSMLPEGIRNGHELLTRSVVGNGGVACGDFIIISVDNSFYQFRHQGKKPHFVQKLRKAICKVDDDMSASQLCEQLKGTFAEPFEDKEKKDLRDSLAEARTFYGNTCLFLSATYHDGDIHFSFHPFNNICYRVEGVAYREGEEIKFKTAAELAD